jgi:hypothetical protein
MRSPKWKLVNRDLKDGYVTVTKEELTRLMEEMVRDRVQKGLPLEIKEDTCQKLTSYINPIKAELENQGHIFRSKTDTEVIAHLIENAVKKGSPLVDATREAVNRLDGSYAIAVIYAKEPDKLFVPEKRAH